MVYGAGSSCYNNLYRLVENSCPIVTPELPQNLKYGNGNRAIVGVASFSVIRSSRVVFFLRCEIYSRTCSGRILPLSKRRRINTGVDWQCGTTGIRTGILPSLPVGLCAMGERILCESQ